MTLDVVYISYHKDLIWLVYSLQLLFKHFRSAFGVTVRLEEDCRDVVKDWGVPVNYVYTKPWPDGYTFAMYQKLICDQCSQADLIMILDSDHLLLEPVYLEDIMDHGKPIIRYRNWNDDPNDRLLAASRQTWGPPTERTLGIPLDRDYMVGPPFLFWRDTFAKVRNRVEEVTGLPFFDAIYSDTPYDYRNFAQHQMKFCDYEALGLYGAKFEPDRYSLLHHPQGTHTPFRVYWSHGDWTPALQAKLDTLLAA